MCLGTLLACPLLYLNLNSEESIPTHIGTVPQTAASDMELWRVFIGARFIRGSLDFRGI